MNREQEDPLAIVQLEQCGAEQRPDGELEPALRQRGREPPRFRLAFRLRQMRQIDHLQRHGGCGMHHLHRLSVDHGKCRAQAFVPAHDLVDRTLQHARVDECVHRHHCRNVVKCVVRRQLVEKPKPLLREGQRQRLVARRARDPQSRSARRAQQVQQLASVPAHLGEQFGGHHVLCCAVAQLVSLDPQVHALRPELSDQLRCRGWRRSL